MVNLFTSEEIIEKELSDLFSDTLGKGTSNAGIF